MRAFTIVELLIAIGVLIAILSLVAPNVYTRLAITRGEEARSMLGDSLVEARALAARTGEPVRVFARERRDFTIDIVHEPLSESEDEQMTVEPFMLDEPVEQADLSIRAESHMSLPQGCRFELVSTLDAVGSVEALLEEERLPAPDRTLAILLPDGSAILGATLALITPRGDAFTMSIQTWGGGASFDRWESEALPGYEDEAGSGSRRPGAGMGMDRP